MLFKHSSNVQSKREYCSICVDADDDGYMRFRATRGPVAFLDLSGETECFKVRYDGADGDDFQTITTTICYKSGDRLVLTLEAVTPWAGHKIGAVYRYDNSIQDRLSEDSPLTIALVEPIATWNETANKYETDYVAVMGLDSFISKDGFSTLIEHLEECVVRLPDEHVTHEHHAE